jgi:hypothetical protein
MLDLPGQRATRAASAATMQLPSICTCSLLSAVAAAIGRLAVRLVLVPLSTRAPHPPPLQHMHALFSNRKRTLSI